MAFVTRSHQHLWGKNNEDPLVFLYGQGITNQLAKDLLLGWNKFGQERPPENWGIGHTSHTGQKLYLPPGIVIPFIVHKELKAIFIHPLDCKPTGMPRFCSTLMVQGSGRKTLVLGESCPTIAFVRHVFHGLYLFQESRGKIGVIIHPDPNVPLDPVCRSIVKSAGKRFVCASDKKEQDLNRALFPDLPEECFHTYHAKEELTAHLLSF